MLAQNVIIIKNALCHTRCMRKGGEGIFLSLRKPREKQKEKMEKIGHNKQL